MSQKAAEFLLSNDNVWTLYQHHVPHLSLFALSCGKKLLSKAQTAIGSGTRDSPSWNPAVDPNCFFGPA